MAYLPNIPQPGDLLATSQGNLLGNMQAIMALIDVNHVDFASSDQGKHFVVTLPVQADSPPSGYTFINNEVGLYCYNNALTTDNEVYIHTNMSGGAVIAEVPLTASNQASKGWCYLPSGIILKWGSGSTSGSTSIVSVNGPGLGPNFTNIFQTLATNSSNSFITSGSVIGIDTAILLPNIGIYSNLPVAGFSYFVIGN
jgi:hypothetical protein